MITWFNCLILSHRCVLIGVGTWIFNDNLNWNFVSWTVWVCDDNCCVFITLSCCINRCLVFELSTFWKVTNVANWILSVWLVAWFNCLVLSYRCILIRIRTWIFNSYFNWNFILRAIWISDDDCCIFFAFCCCVNWCLVLEGSAFWKVTNVANWIFGIWLITWFNCLILSYRCILIRIRTWIFNDYLNWNFILRTIWVSDNDCCVFVTLSCCINRCLVLKRSAFWKVTNVANWIFGIWLITWFNCLILSYWGILIGIGTWIFDDYLNCNFVFWTVWVCHDNNCVFFAFCGCINWCLVLKLSSFWKVAYVADWILSVWLIAWFNCLIFSYRCVLICIGTRIFDCYLNWNFVFWTVWVSDNDCCVFVTFSRSINRCLVLKFSAFWKVAYVANWILSVWLITWFNCLIFSYRCVLIGIGTWIFDDYLNWNFIFRTIWVCHYNCCVFVTFSRSINRCLVLKFSAFWKVAYVANWILSVWLITWFNRLIFSYRCVLIRICAWVFDSYLNWNLVFWTIWVSHDNSSVFFTFCSCIYWCLELEGCATWKIGNITDRVLRIWCVSNFNSLILSSRCVLIRIGTWIFNSYLNWNLVFWTIWICYYYCSVFVTFCSCIYWCLVLKLSTTWKIWNVTNWTFSVWCVTDINRLILSSRCVLIRIGTWIFNSYLNWNLVFWTIWICYYYCSVFVTFCSCIYWCLVLKLSTTWKIWNVTNWTFSVWCVTDINRLILSSRCVLIRIGTWIFNSYLNWNLIFWTIWVSYDNSSILFTCCCCINWGLVLKGCFTWKIWNITNWVLGIWCVAKVNRLILSYRCILICICAWIYNRYLNWDFILRTIWISYNNCCVFFTCSCCIYWCLVFECSTTWKVWNITNWTFGIWCFANVNRLIFSCWFILISICLFSLDFDWNIDSFSCSIRICHKHWHIYQTSRCIGRCLTCDSTCIFIHRNRVNSSWKCTSFESCTWRYRYFLAFNITYKWNLWLSCVSSSDYWFTVSHIISLILRCINNQKVSIKEGIGIWPLMNPFGITFPATLNGTQVWFNTTFHPLFKEEHAIIFLDFSIQFLSQFNWINCILNLVRNCIWTKLSWSRSKDIFVNITTNLINITLWWVRFCRNTNGICITCIKFPWCIHDNLSFLNTTYSRAISIWLVNISFVQIKIWQETLRQFLFNIRYRLEGIWS